MKGLRLRNWAHGVGDGDEREGREQIRGRGEGRDKGWLKDRTRKL